VEAAKTLDQGLNLGPSFILNCLCGSTILLGFFVVWNSIHFRHFRQHIDSNWQNIARLSVDNDLVDITASW